MAKVPLKSRTTVILGHRLTSPRAQPAFLAAFRAEHPAHVHGMLGATWIGVRMADGDSPSSKEIDAAEIMISKILPGAGELGAMTSFSVNRVETDLPEETL